MSQTEVHYGFIVPLIGFKADHRELLRDALHDNDDDDVRVNYEGTLLFVNMNDERDEIMITVVGEPSANGKQRIREICEKYSLKIDPLMMKPYVCIWYNGCDHPLCEMTLAEFRKLTVAKASE